jgi:hydrogenase nickel incorporation protein HypA/HybF
MHELSIASAVAEKVMDFARTHQPGRVLQVRLAVGEMTCLQKEQLAFCYRAITQETPIEDSTLEIEPVATIVNCPGCGYTGSPKYWEDGQWQTSIPTLACPGCGATAEAIQGHECAIRTITYAT